MCAILILVLGIVVAVQSLHLRFQPPEGAFFIRHQDYNPPSSQETLTATDSLGEQRAHNQIPWFLPDDCPTVATQSLMSSHAGVHKALPLLSLYASSAHPHCGIGVQLVDINEVAQARPIIDLVVHADSSFVPSDGRPLCANVYAIKHDEYVRTACQFTAHHTDCLLRLMLPLAWWYGDSKRHVELKYRISYGECDTRSMNMVHRLDRHMAAMKLHVRPVSEVPLKQDDPKNYHELTIDDDGLRKHELALTEEHSSWKVSLLQPKQSLHAGSVFTTHIQLQYKVDNNRPLYMVVLECTPQPGMVVLSVQNATGSGWITSVSSKVNPISYTITVYNERQLSSNGTDESWSGIISSLVLQVDNSLFQPDHTTTTHKPTVTTTTANQDKQAKDSATDVEDYRIVEVEWSVRYVADQHLMPVSSPSTADAVMNDGPRSSEIKSNYIEDLDKESKILPVAKSLKSLKKDQQKMSTEKKTSMNTRRVMTSFRVLPDKLYAIVPITTAYQMVNTAVLSGRQISHTLKVFTVSHGGAIADVTFGGCKCFSADDSVLKVSPTCANIYVDGSETTGAVNATVFVNFDQSKSEGSNLMAALSIIVWYPDLPLDVTVGDPVLNAVRDWSLPSSSQMPVYSPPIDSAQNRHKRSAMQFVCATRYQEAQVRVYATFSVSSGTQRSQLGGLQRRLEFDVTALVSSQMKTSNQSIARLALVPDGALIVRGISNGTTSIHVLSYTNKQTVIGRTNIQVSNTMVHVSKLTPTITVHVNISLNMSPVPQQIVATIRHGRMFIAQFQTGYATLSVEYSDGHKAPLDWVPANQYMLTVWPMDKQKVFLQPAHVDNPNYPIKLAGSHSISDIHTSGYIKILVADDDGAGTELQFQLKPADGCQKADGTALIEAIGRVEAHFHTSTRLPLPPHLQESLEQNNYVDETSISKENDDKPWKERPSYNDYENRIAVTDTPIRTTQRTAVITHDSTARYQPDKRNLMETRREDGDVAKSLTSFEVAMLVILALLVLIGSAFGLNYCLTAARPTNGSMPRSYKFQKLVPMLPDFLLRGRAADQQAEEWVWLSRDQIEASSSAAGSIGSSKYSRRSTMEVERANEYNRMQTQQQQPLQPQPQQQQQQTMPFGYTNNTGDRCRTRSSAHSGSYHGSSEQRSVSYRGSEISIFLSQHPSMQVHEHASTMGTPYKQHHQQQQHISQQQLLQQQQQQQQQQQYQPLNPAQHGYYYTPDCVPASYHSIMPYYAHNTIQNTPVINRRAASWTKQRNKVRITTNPMVDSSSEQNLSTLGVTSPVFDQRFGVMARSAGQMEWDAGSITWDDSELQNYFGNLRESMA